MSTMMTFEEAVAYAPSCLSADDLRERVRSGVFVPRVAGATVLLEQRQIDEWLAAGGKGGEEARAEADAAAAKVAAAEALVPLRGLAEQAAGYLVWAGHANAGTIAAALPGALTGADVHAALLALATAAELGVDGVTCPATFAESYVPVEAEATVWQLSE